MVMRVEEVPVATARGQTMFERVATFALIAALLYFGAGIFVPLVLATLLAFALTPVVTWLTRRVHIPDVLAVVFAVLMVVAILAAFSAVAGMQLMSLAQELPGYQATITAKIAALQAQFGGLTLLQQVQDTFASLGSQLQANAEPVRPENAPLPVTISNELGPLGILTSLLGSIIGPIATVAIVAVFLIFLLLGRADLQDRFIRLVSAGRYSLTAIAIADASKRVGRYLIIQLCVNITYGLIFGTGLWLIGVPSAPLWGLLIILFRYIPFVGALIIATVPFLLAFAVDPGWNMLIFSVGLFLLLDLTTANIIEPRLYGSSTGVSPIAILLSAMFWAALWGPVGLILATPMTVCLVVIGRHLPQLQFFETLLGSEPVLTPIERLYNRLLKGDTEGAIALADEHSDAVTTDSYLDETLLPVLQLAERERSDDPHTLEQRRLFIQSFDALVHDLYEEPPSAGAEILLIGGKSEIDEGAAYLLGVHFAQANHPTRILPPVAIRQEAIGRLELDGIKTIVFVFLGDDIRVQSRYATRRIRRINPSIRLVALLLSPEQEDTPADALHVDALYRTVPDVVEAVTSYVHPVSSTSVIKPRALLGLRDNPALASALDAIAARFGMPIAAVNLLDDERHMADDDAARLTSHIVETRKPLVVRVDHPHPQLGESAYIQTNGIGLYAGVPMIVDGSPVGALVLMDYEPTTLTDQQIADLATEADHLVERLLLRRQEPV